jgi:hypothetical protein
MISDRKKPGVAFWATLVVVAVLVAYPLSIGPAYWLKRQDWAYGSTHGAFHAVYGPIIWIYQQGPQPAHDAIGWYVDLWL